MLIFPYTLGTRIVFFLLSEAFCGLKYAENAIAAGALTRTPLGELTTPPRSLVGWVADTPPHTSPNSAPLAPRRSRLRRLDRRACLTPNPGDATGHHHFKVKLRQWFTRCGLNQLSYYIPRDGIML